MEKFLHPMFVFDVLLPMGAGMAFCFWMLWDLRKENKAAEARKAALAALQTQTAAARATAAASATWGAPTSGGVTMAPVRGLSLAAPSPVLPTTPSLPSTVLMSDVRKLSWDDMAVEELTPLIGRRLVYTEKQMLAHVYLKQGAIVPAHDHVNEQITYILSGALRFWIGEHADAPGSEFVDVRAGEVLVIPSMVRHRAEALEDTLDVDIFNPPRQDWIDKSDNYLRTGEPMSNGGQG
jgi:quercetin dioxygenase-like cupin family protein